MITMLITGSGGFIGSNLKNYFKGQYDILSPRSKELNLIDKKQVAEYFQNNDIDLVIHCASVGGAQTEKAFSGGLDFVCRGIPDCDSCFLRNFTPSRRPHVQFFICICHLHHCVYCRNGLYKHGYIRQKD